MIIACTNLVLYLETTGNTAYKKINIFINIESNVLKYENLSDFF